MYVYLPVYENNVDSYEHTAPRNNSDDIAEFAWESQCSPCAFLGGGGGPFDNRRFISMFRF